MGAREKAKLAEAECTGEVRALEAAAARRPPRGGMAMAMAMAEPEPVLEGVVVLDDGGQGASRHAMRRSGRRPTRS